ncbi:MAG: DUF1292 domain-containing protein [Clostridia bacterium]|nr:DUF1292 domain-containing protein [Clostridia bacterium]
MSDIEKDEIITLTDEDGNEINFVVVYAVEYNGKDYLALVEEEHYEDETCEFTILRVDETEGDDALLETIEDEDEFNNVLALIENNLDDEFEISDIE